MRKSNTVLAAYFVLVFLVGGVLGALAFRLYTVNSVSANRGRRNPEEYRKRYVEEMTTRLKLDEAQLKQLNIVLDQTRDDMRTIHEKYQPEMRVGSGKADRSHQWISNRGTKAGIPEDAAGTGTEDETVPEPGSGLLTSVEN